MESLTALSAFLERELPFFCCRWRGSFQTQKHSGKNIGISREDSACSSSSVRFLSCLASNSTGTQVLLWAQDFCFRGRGMPALSSKFWRSLAWLMWQKAIWLRRKTGQKTSRFLPEFCSFPSRSMCFCAKISWKNRCDREENIDDYRSKQQCVIVFADD